MIVLPHGPGAITTPSVLMFCSNTARKHGLDHERLNQLSYPFSLGWPCLLLHNSDTKVFPSSLRKQHHQPESSEVHHTRPEAAHSYLQLMWWEMATAEELRGVPSRVQGQHTPTVLISVLKRQFLPSCWVVATIQRRPVRLSCLTKDALSPSPFPL